jgi:hypothetical protein
VGVQNDLPESREAEDELRQTIGLLARRVAELENRTAEPGTRALGLSDDKLATVARSIYRTRRRRLHYFDQSLFADPAWDMMLDLFINKVGASRVSTTSLCLAAGVAQATGIRWVQLLEEQGLLRRFKAPDDGRLVLIEITPHGYRLMRQCLTESVTRFEWPMPD